MNFTCICILISMAHDQNGNGLNNKSLGLTIYYAADPQILEVEVPM